MTDEQLREHFGLSEGALARFRMKKGFPRFPPRDEVAKKTDSRAVEVFFDVRSGIAPPSTIGGRLAVVDGKENFRD